MLHGHPSSTIASVGKFRWEPIVAQGHGIVECRLVYCKAVLKEGKNCEPGRGTLSPSKVHSPLQGGRQIVVEVIGFISTLLSILLGNGGLALYLFSNGLVRIDTVLAKDMILERGGDKQRRLKFGNFGRNLIPRHPSRAGRANSVNSRSLDGSLPVIAGSMSNLSTSSKGES